MSLDALSFLTGVAEGDLKNKDADIKLALEEFKENKQLVTDLAKTRYARDLKKYDEEVAKLDSLKSAYSYAENLGPVQAAKIIARAEDKDFYDGLTLAEKEEHAANIANNFTYNYKEYKEGDKIPEGFKVGDRVKDSNGNDVIESFTFKRKDYTLTEPKQSEYFLDNELFKEGRENIAKDTTSFLGGQIRELLGKDKKTPDNTNYLQMAENKKVSEIKNNLDDDAEYTSKNLSTAMITGAKLYNVKESQKKVYERVIKEYDESTGITTNNILKAVINPIIQLDKKVSDNYTLDQVKGELKVSGDGQHIGFVSNQLWNHINLAKRESIEYYNVPDASGNSNVGDFRKWDVSKITDEYQSKWRERHLKLSNETLIPFDSKTASLSGITLIPLEILPVQVNLSEEERKFIEGNVNVVIKGTKGNIADNKTLIYGSITDSLIALGKGELLNTTAYATKETTTKGIASYDAKNNTIIVNEKIGNIDVGVYPVDGIKEEIKKGVELPEDILKLIPSINNESYDSKMNNIIKKDKNTGVEYIPFG
jgi:hypothetical protein